METALHSEAMMPGRLVDDVRGDASDEQLMLAFAQGSEAAFAELFGRYKQPLFGFFRRRVADVGLAEELTQETFVVVLRGARRYEARALFRTYLYAVALKKLHVHRRRAAFRATFFGGEREGAEVAARSGLDAEVQMRQAFGRLEAMDREVLLLREFEQLSYAEIAELLKLPVNTVRSRLFRARGALREILVSRPGAAKAEIVVGTEERA